MFREMRRSRQQLTREEAEAVLSRGTSGVLSVLGDEGYPYGVPLSYVYHDGKLYFHWARSGHKLDAVRACHKASFCVVDRTRWFPGSTPPIFAVPSPSAPSESWRIRRNSRTPCSCWPSGTPRSSPRPTTSGRSTAFLQPVHRGADGPAPHREGGHRAGPAKAPDTP